MASMAEPSAVIEVLTAVTCALSVVLTCSRALSSAAGLKVIPDPIASSVVRTSAAAPHTDSAHSPLVAVAVAAGGAELDAGAGWPVSGAGALHPAASRSIVRPRMMGPAWCGWARHPPWSTLRVLSCRMTTSLSVNRGWVRAVRTSSRLRDRLPIHSTRYERHRHHPEQVKGSAGAGPLTSPPSVSHPHPRCALRLPPCQLSAISS